MLVEFEFGDVEFCGERKAREKKSPKEDEN